MVSIHSGSPKNFHGQATVDPTPDEIRQRSAAIRATWSAHTRQQRSVFARLKPWLPPEICLADVAANASQHVSN